MSVIGTFPSLSEGVQLRPRNGLPVAMDVQAWPTLNKRDTTKGGGGEEELGPGHVVYGVLQVAVVAPGCGDALQDALLEVVLRGVVDVSDVVLGAPATADEAR